MIAPVYGFRQDTVLEKDLPKAQSEKTFDEFDNHIKNFSAMNRSNPIGLIQLINKNNYQPITEFDT